MKSRENKSYARLSIDQAAMYRIGIHGELEEKWSDRMGGMQINRQIQDDGSILTVLEGQLLDQAALFGVLVAIYNMHLPLIYVECLDSEWEDENPLMKVRVEHREDYLEFIVSGVQNNIPIPEPLETILNSCELAGLYQVLVDFRGLEGGDRENPEIGYAQGVGLGYQDYLDGGGTPIKVAVVGKEEMIEAWKKSEKIVQDLGLDAFVTSDYEDAINWLRSDRKSQ